MASASSEEHKLSLRVLIDSERNKVVFAEADHDFVDVLFSFMTLPLGTIVRLLEKHFGRIEGAIGSLNALYDSIKRLGSSRFSTEEARLSLLYTRNSFEDVYRGLKINVDDTEPTKYFICGNVKCTLNDGSKLNVSTFNVSRCECGELMNREVAFKASDVQAKEGVFTTGMTSFIIMDDLHVIPSFACSSVELLKNAGIKRITVVQERSFALGLKEVINLLKCSIFSKTALSDVLLRADRVKPETFLPDMSRTSLYTSLKMVLKVVLQKSSRKVFFAQADEHFVDFLFGLLAIPLGCVAKLLGGNTSLGSIDNLYKSIGSENTCKCLKSDFGRPMLIQPMLHPHYQSKTQIIFNLLCRNSLPLSYQRNNASGRCDFSLMTSYSNVSTGRVTLKLPTINSAFVRGPAWYMVTDDLEVTPLSSISTTYVLKKFDVSLDDVEEMDLSIGAQEALGILKASLSTTSALTNGLKSMLNKRLKLDK